MLSTYNARKVAQQLAKNTVTRTVLAGTQVRYFDGKTWESTAPIPTEITAEGSFSVYNRFLFKFKVGGKMRQCSVDFSELKSE